VLPAAGTVPPGGVAVFYSPAPQSGAPGQKSPRPPHPRRAMSSSACFLAPALPDGRAARWSDLYVSTSVPARVEIMPQTSPSRDSGWTGVLLHDPASDLGRHLHVVADVRQRAAAIWLGRRPSRPTCICAGRPREVAPADWSQRDWAAQAGAPARLLSSASRPTDPPRWIRGRGGPRRPGRAVEKTPVPFGSLVYSPRR